MIISKFHLSYKNVACNPLDTEFNSRRLQCSIPNAFETVVLIFSATEKKGNLSRRRLYDVAVIKNS